MPKALNNAEFVFIRPHKQKPIQNLIKHPIIGIYGPLMLTNATTLQDALIHDSPLPKLIADTVSYHILK